MSYANLELSDPAFEHDHLRMVTFQSPALGRRGDYSLYVPPGIDGLSSIPAVILLHGVYGSHWAWALKGGAHLLANQMIESGDLPPMLLIMPSDGLWAEGSGYIRHTTADYEKWIVEEVVNCTRDIVNQFTTTSPLFIAGLSMGGYGALRLGGKHPSVFSGISAHSSATAHLLLQEAVKQPIDFFPEEDDDGTVLYWMQRNHDRLPPIRFDCGVDDFLIAFNRLLDDDLKLACIPHVYEEFPGAHTWEYWSTHLRDTLRFFAEILRKRQ